MRNMIILFLLLSTLFMFATTQEDSNSILELNQLDNSFTKYTNHYFFSPSSNVETNSPDLTKRELSKSIFSKPILKDMGLL